MEKSQPQIKTNRIASRVRVIFFVIPILVAVIILGIGQVISHAIAGENAMRMSRQYAIEAAANFLSATNSHFVLAQQLAHSTTISRWISDEYNPENRARAIEEITGYAEFKPYAFLMFTVYETHNVYDLRPGFTEEDFVVWWQIFDGGDGALWFTNTRDAELPFNLNIQRSRPVDGQWELYLWTNHRMYYDGRFVGVATVGSPFETVFDAVFGIYDGGTRRGYIIDYDGLVRVDSAGLLTVHNDGLSSPATMPETLDNPVLADEIDLHLQTMVNGAFRFDREVGDAISLSGDFRYASIAPIVGINWSVVVLSSIPSAFDIRYMPLMAAAAVLIIAVLLFGGFLIQRTVLQPIQLATLTQQLMYDSVSIPSTLWDISGNLIDCNEAMTDFLGLPSKKDVIKHYYEFTPEYQACGRRTDDICHEELAGIFATGQGIRKRWLHKIGEEIVPVEVTMTRIPMGDTFVCVCYAVDLRQIEETMVKEREAYKKIQEMLDLSPTMINEWSRDIKLIKTNKRAAEWYRVSNEQEYIDRFAELAPEFQPCGTPTWQKAQEFVTEAFEKGSVTFEWVTNTADGEPLPIWVKLVRSSDDENAIVYAFTSDLRDIKKLEAQLREKEINERVKVSEESNRAKSAFLARMSHEIRTPITAVMGISEIEMQNPAISTQTEDSFTKIHNSANQLLSIVNDILDLSKIEAGKMELARIEYDMASLIVDVANIHIGFASSKNIRFNVSVDENLPTRLIGDALRIGQIVNNILSNAFKYTLEGSVDLSFVCLKNDEHADTATLQISVRDSGLGMTPKQLDDLKNEYTRYHERNYQFIEGTGLGMPIVYNLVKLMDAHIEVESEVNAGTNVVVSIPQKTSGTDTLGKETAQNLEQFKETAAIKKFTFTPEPMPYGSVLVVDDVDANLFVAKGLLAFYDLTIETCNNGFDAIEKIKQGKVYDLVFMDYMMPGLNGTETMRKMRDAGYTQPIVALTANAMIGMAEEFIKEGFDGFISKPIQTKQLNTVLTKHIKDKKLPEVAEADITGFQHDPELLAKLRGDFVKRHSNTFDVICNSLNTGDIETAHRLIHTIKGLAGMLYENALMEAANEIEQVLASKNKPTSAQLSALESEMNRVLSDIGETQALSSDELFAEYVSPEEALALLEKTAPLLASRSIDSLKMLNELKKIPQSDLLRSQIEDFDFETALDTVNELKIAFVKKTK